MCDQMPYLNLGAIIPPGSWDILNPDHKSGLNLMYRDAVRCIQRTNFRDWHYVDLLSIDLDNDGSDYVQ